MKTINQIKDIQKILYTDLGIHSPKERRQLLIQEMKALEGSKIDCYNCTGTCCTFSANSMQITPIEAFEIILSLDVTMEHSAVIKNQLKENINHFRLDHQIFSGKKNNSHLRRTYTCPFFVAGSKGCTIKKELKPYGCLGFNPRIENDNGGQCNSDQTLLEQRENFELQNEEKANLYLKEINQINWVKLEIPRAVLFLLDKFFPEA